MKNMYSLKKKLKDTMFKIRRGCDTVIDVELAKDYRQKADSLSTKGQVAFMMAITHLDLPIYRDGLLGTNGDLRRVLRLDFEESELGELTYITSLYIQHTKQAYYDGKFTSVKQFEEETGLIYPKTVY